MKLSFNKEKLEEIKDPALGRKEYYDKSKGKTTPLNQNILTLLVKMCSFDYLLAVQFIFEKVVPHFWEKYQIRGKVPNFEPNCPIIPYPNFFTLLIPSYFTQTF